MMLMMGTRIAPRRLQVRDDITFSEDRQAFDQLGRQIAAAGSDERGMEFAIADCDLAQLRGGRPVETSKRIEHMRAILVVCHGRGEGRSVRFDFQAKIVDFVELARRHRPDDIAAVRLAGEQSVLLQARQRFTQRNLADAQLIGERVLADRLIVTKLSSDDLLADNLEYLIGQRLDDDGHGSAGPFGWRWAHRTWKPFQKGSSRSIQMVLNPVATAEPSIDGTIASTSPTRAAASTRPMNRLPI